jgi:YidC/Oxa1 family membrane protein insertase
MRAIENTLGQALSLFYDIVPSFGVAIVLLTIAINLLLFPLTLKQTRSTRAFQAIQPEIKRIQKEYKEEPEKMQQELMRVQREAGATPLGCFLPIVVQMPIWFALFRLLRDVASIVNGVPPENVPIPAGGLLTAVQNGDVNFLGMNLGRLISDGVTGSGFPGAIPYAMLIVIMVVSQYIQQWHAQRGSNLSNAELTQQQRSQQQTQQMLTRVMPLFIGFVSWNFPAGLAVYWATGNLFRLGQQFAIFAIDGRPGHGGSSGGGGGSESNDPEPEGGGNGSGDGDTDDEGSDKADRPHPVSEKKRRRRRR